MFTIRPEYSWNITTNKEYEILRKYRDSNGNNIYVVINDIGEEDHYNIISYFESPENDRARKLRST